MNNYKEILEENIEDYVHGRLSGDELMEFEAQIFSDIELEKEVAKHVLQQMKENTHTTLIKVSNKVDSHNDALLSDSKRCNVKGFGLKTKSLFKKFFGLPSAN